MTETIYTLHSGTRPLLISVPHVGTRIPVDQTQRYLPRALDVEDTDWHLERVYAFAKAMGASLNVQRYSRFLIDLNGFSPASRSISRARHRTRTRSRAGARSTGSPTTTPWHRNWAG